MKKFFSFMVWMTLLTGFVACDNEVEDYDVRINPITPDLMATGVYEGIWERMLLSDSSVVEGEGSVIVEADTAYLVTLHFISEEFGLDKSAVANITYANKGLRFFNHVADPNSELKAAFVGLIDEEGVNTTSFTITQMENRRVKKFRYSFVGRKIDSPAGEGEKE